MLKKVTFTQGSLLLRGELVTDLPIQKTDISFFCAGALCDSDSPIIITEDKVESLNKYHVNMVACANEQKVDPPKYCVVFSPPNDPKLATDECTKQCDLN